MKNILKRVYTHSIFGQNDLVAGVLSVSVEEVNASVPGKVNAFSTMFSVHFQELIPATFPPLNISNFGCEKNFSVHFLTWQLHQLVQLACM